MGVQYYFDNYSPVGDITVAGMCLVIFVLIGTSYVKKTKAFGVYLNIVIYLFLAALCDLFYHTIYTFITDGNYTLVYVMRLIYHALLFSNLLLYVVYIVVLERLERDKKLPVMILSTLVYVAVLVMDVVTAIQGKGFRLDASGKTISGKNYFLLGYLLFMTIILFLLFAYRKRVFRRVMLGFYGTILISFLVLYAQGRHGQSSFTVVSFLFPAVAMLYIVHSTPYDIETGSVSIKALEDMVQYNHKRNRTLIYMSLYLPDMDEEGRSFTEALQDTIRRFSAEYFKEAVLFQVSNGHVVLFARESKKSRL